MTIQELKKKIDNEIPNDNLSNIRFSLNQLLKDMVDTLGSSAPNSDAYLKGVFQLQQSGTGNIGIISKENTIGDFVESYNDGKYLYITFPSIDQYLNRVWIVDSNNSPSSGNVGMIPIGNSGGGGIVGYFTIQVATDFGGTTFYMQFADPSFNPIYPSSILSNGMVFSVPEIRVYNT